MELVGDRSPDIKFKGSRCSCDGPDSIVVCCEAKLLQTSQCSGPASLRRGLEGVIDDYPVVMLGHKI
jgi:hypothetical protein